MLVHTPGSGGRPDLDPTALASSGEEDWSLARSLRLLLSGCPWEGLITGNYHSACNQTPASTWGVTVPHELHATVLMKSVLLVMIALNAYITDCEGVALDLIPSIA